MVLMSCGGQRRRVQSGKRGGAGVGGSDEGDCGNTGVGRLVVSGMVKAGSLKSQASEKRRNCPSGRWVLGWWGAAEGISGPAREWDGVARRCVPAQSSPGR